MPVFAAGLTLNALGAVFLYLSTPDDFTGSRREGSASEEGSHPTGEAWRPDQGFEGLSGWLRSRSKRKFGFLLMAVGFALQLVGYFVPGSRYVM